MELLYFAYYNCTTLIPKPKRKPENPPLQSSPCGHARPVRSGSLSVPVFRPPRARAKAQAAKGR